MMKVSQVVVEEFHLIAGALVHKATEYGFDLSKDDDVNRLNLISVPASRRSYDGDQLLGS